MDSDAVLQELKQLQSQVEEELQRRALAVEGSLSETVRYAWRSPGKRLRPVLCLATSKLFEIKSPPLDYALAIELFHASSLVHDDLPALDNDTLRRGLPTTHARFGEGPALLAGDEMIALAFEVIMSSHDCDTSQKVQLTTLLARAIRSVCQGQMLDLAAEGCTDAPTLAALEEIHLLKTASLFRAAILGPSLLTAASKEQGRALELYANRLGLMFQTLDDVLDVTEESEALGKDSGSDTRRALPTMVSLLGVEGARARAKNLLHQALEALEPFGEKSWFLRSLTQLLFERKS